VTPVLPLASQPELSARALLVVPGDGAGYCLRKKLKDAIMGAVFMATNCHVAPGTPQQLVLGTGGLGTA
jgi:hypothetical protein